MDRVQLVAKLEAAVWLIVAELGAREATEMLDRMKQKVGEAQWNRSK